MRLDLDAIAVSLDSVREHWTAIDDALAAHGIGRKDTPFTALIQDRMMSAYRYLDASLAADIDPFEPASIPQWLELNHRVHYGEDYRLRQEFRKALAADSTKFHGQVPGIVEWYHRHRRRGDPVTKIAAEIYMAVVGQPQLFIEGNHRTGSLIASWICAREGAAPFVLSRDNAIAYFGPSAEIKNLDAKSSWRGRRKLPKYKKTFRAFWEAHSDPRFLRPDP